MRANARLRTWLPLGLALFGYWTPWLTHPAASLRLNGYELSEWVTFLPGVRAGALPLSRLAFLTPLACLALLLGVAAFRFRQPGPPRRNWLLTLVPDSPWGGGLLFAALLCCVTVFPPYPYLLTAYADPEYRLQLLVAIVTLLGLGLIPFLTKGMQDVLQVMAALVAGALGVWLLVNVQAEASRLLNATWPVGPGWAAMLLGFVGLLVAGWARLFGRKDPL
ncbi:MAG: hypothetical protein ACRDH2_09315 [Anaerolineales bacterium]